jgi:hypothetical protein
VNKRLALIALLPLLCASCAFMNPRNRRLMNFCEKHLIPESTTGRVLTAPVVLPVCLVAGVVDTVLIHPATTIDDAWYDTDAALWQPTKRGFVTESALLPFRSVATPPIWALGFLSRSVFDVRPWPPSPKQLRGLLLDDDPDARLAAVKELNRWTYKGKDIAPATQAILLACRRYHRDSVFRSAAMLRLPRPLTADAREYLAQQAQSGAGRTCAAAIERLFVDCLYTPRTSAEKLGAAKQVNDTVQALIQVHAGLVKNDHREAELYLMGITAYNVRPRVVNRGGRRSYTPGPEGPKVLALYIARSLAGRNDPDYAAAAAFLTQTRLLQYTHAARIDAVSYEWRALTHLPTWPMMAAKAIQRQLEERDPLLSAQRIAALLAKQKELEKGLGSVDPSMAGLRLPQARQLAMIRTALDAEQIAQRLIKGPKRDLNLFKGDPLKLLRQRTNLEQ